MSVDHIKLKLTGVGPMLMHSSKLADPFEKVTKALTKITGKAKKTDADHLRIAELEFRGGLWLHHGFPCLPQQTIKSVCVDGAKKAKQGEIAKAAFRSEGAALLQYDGPKTVDALWADENFRHRAIVRVRGSLTVRTRPMFQEWSAIVHGSFLPSMLDREEIVGFFQTAGLFGLGDYTPEFGRFVAEEVQLE
ncbi:hypothetical protein PMN64_00545 [Bradyrhizobium sp. UFLA01-814]|uniref:hypothetical protein n=1 Tax=Bradyrhizobium sp. UFLA01-814 TaxID=3023480 RepID=UPI00398AA6B4